MKKTIFSSFVLLSLMLFFSCNQSKTLGDKNSQTTEQSVSKDNCKDVHWSHHKGEDGPSHWKNLCAGFAQCAGKSQSPINIVDKDLMVDTNLKAPEFHYETTKVDIINNGHTVQFNVDTGNYVILNGKKYTLLQFHYHALSEHTIDGKHSPLEVHFVHKHSDNDYAVIGFMIVAGKENQLFKKYLDNFPTKKGEYKANQTIDLLSLLPDNMSYYYYKGSLTTPPCSEVVTWYFLKYYVEASKAQIKKFSEILDNNYRPVMPLSGRKVKLYLEK